MRTLAQRINDKYGDGNYVPIILAAGHHGQAQISEYFRAVEVCMVTSLHDGMNLVAKEFVDQPDVFRQALVRSDRGSRNGKC